MWPDRVAEFLANDNWQNDQGWQQTIILKNVIHNYRNGHPNLGLTHDLFNRIIQWKLRNQIHRVNHHLENLNEQMVFSVTKAAFEINHNDFNILTTVRINLLKSLPGVGLGVASAILTLYYPEIYGIIDFRSWDEITEQDPALPTITRNFSMNNYLSYLDSIRPFAAEHNIDVQTVDYALWTIWKLRRP